MPRNFRVIAEAFGWKLNKLRMELEITLQQGGMREFERTGIYPEYLIFQPPWHQKYMAD